MKSKKPITDEIGKSLKNYANRIVPREKITNEELIKLLNKLKKGKMPKDEIPHIISIFGKNRFLEAKKEVEKYIDREDEIIRYNVLSTLILDWGLKEHYKTAIRMLNDSDEEVRGMAVACIGSLKRGTKDGESLRIVLRVFEENKNNWFMRDSAYEAILNIEGVPEDKRPTKRILNPKKDIDWNLIHKIEKRLKKKNVK